MTRVLEVEVCLDEHCTIHHAVDARLLPPVWLPLDPPPPLAGLPECAEHLAVVPGTGFGARFNIAYCGRCWTPAAVGATAEQQMFWLVHLLTGRAG